MNMNIMMITPTFPPVGGSHSLRMLKMANSLIEEGNDVSVITYNIIKTHPNYDESILSQVNKKIKIIRVPIGFFHYKAYTTFSMQLQNRDMLKSFSSGIKNMFFYVFNKCKEAIFFPDAMIDWYFPVMKFIKKYNVIKEIHPQVLISCSMPNSVHLITYKLHIEYGIPFIMDYADPWGYLQRDIMLKSKFRLKLERWLEKKILKEAAGYSFSALGCAELYIEKYEIDRKKTVIAMSGYDKCLREIAINYNLQGRKKRNSVISFIYSGSLEGYVRDPKPFFSAVAKLNNYKIKVLMRTNSVQEIKREVIKAKADKYIQIDSYVPFQNYYEEMLKTDVIIFIGNKNNIQIPGKLFNCIATGKPIFYIKSIDREKNDSVEEILMDYGVGIICNNTENEILDCLKKVTEGLSDYLIMKKAMNIEKYSEGEQYRNLNQLVSNVIKIKMD